MVYSQVYTAGNLQECIFRSSRHKEQTRGLCSEIVKPDDKVKLPTNVRYSYSLGGGYENSSLVEFGWVWFGLGEGKRVVMQSCKKWSNQLADENKREYATGEDVIGSTVHLFDIV
jgi:hypothetical protein